MSAVKTQLPDDSESLIKIIEQQAQRIALLEESLRLEKLRKFGSKSEKSTAQQEMFNEAELNVAADAALQEHNKEAELAATSKPAKAAPKPKPGRKPLPESLPRVRVEHELSAEEKQCTCGGQRHVIGEDCSEQLDIIPAQVRVIVHARPKLACTNCEDGIKTVPFPPQPIPKSNASPGLLAHVAVSKYQDALPLYRQEAILNRHGVNIPRNTLANWMIKSGQLIQPLLNLLEDRLLSYPILHCDETRVQVLKEPGKPPTSTSYMWVRVGGPATEPIRLFHYAQSRSGDVAKTLLHEYSGYLQTDDYAGYNAVCASNEIIRLGCWAHTRRKFVEAQKATDAGKSPKTSKADMAISLIGKLYNIERKVRDLTPEERHRIRQNESVPHLHKIRTWLDNNLHNTLPKGLLGKALSYLDSNWSKLNRYTEDGRLHIDNNPAENAIRPFVVGRKNWLFSATVPGAKASANLYSLIETVKANQLDPYAYLRHLFKELPKAEAVEDIEALLPWNLDAEILTGH